MCVREGWWLDGRLVIYMRLEQKTHIFRIKGFKVLFVRKEI